MTGRGITHVEAEPWPEGDGSAFRVKVRAGARREAVGGAHDGRLRVSVTTAPERGKANKAVLSVLARALEAPVSSLAVLAGETDTRKRIGVRGMAPGVLAKRLALLSDGDDA